MKLEQIPAQMSKCLLSAAVRHADVRLFTVDSSLINSRSEVAEPIYGIEIFINDRDRYFSFAVERDGEMKFTRLKEGILENLIYTIRPYDFGFTLTGDIHQRSDVIGKFIEFQINKSAREVMEDTFTVYADASTRERGAIHSICSGFKIDRYHKGTMTFDSTFELMVKSRGDKEFRRYMGKFIEGKLVSVSNKETQTITTMDEIFSI